MSSSDDSIVVVAAGDVVAEDKADKSLPPKAYHRQPLAVLVPILSETDTVIESADSKVAAQRGIPVREAIRSGLAVVGPNAGEAWHTHPDFVDTVLYVAEGAGTFCWKHGEEERRRDVGPGDFVFIRPSSTHQWFNTGDSEMKLVFFQHSHNFD